MKLWHLGVLAFAFGSLTAGCRALPGPEEVTDDGLVRVASRASGGVYRKPDAAFIQYKRLILEPPTVAFKRGWRRSHPEITDAEAKRIEQDTSAVFREEFLRGMIGEDKWALADAPDSDVIIVVPRIVDLDIPAPEAGSEISGLKTYTPGPVKMEIIGDLRDAQTGTLIGRVAMFDGNELYSVGDLSVANNYGNGLYPGAKVRSANKVTNIHEMRMSFGRWSRLLAEALAVAKATRPHRSVPDAAGELKPSGQAEKTE